MVRNYKPKVGGRKYAAYLPSKLQEAVDKITSGELKLNRASLLYNIPKGTLHNKVKKIHRKDVGHPPVFSESEEKSLVTHAQTVSEWGFPLTTLDLRMVAKTYLDQKGRKEKVFKNNMPSSEWARSFLKRHRNSLTQRTCQNIKKVRAGICVADVNRYFENLRISLQKDDGSTVEASNIFNYDETNLTDDPGVKKCVFRRGIKYPERVRDSTKSSTSIMFCGNAVGQVLPPYVVHKSDHLWNLWTEGGIKKARYNRSKSGWFDGTTFTDWFETIFVPHARKLVGKVVIIGDNLASHFTEVVIQKAIENNIAFVCLPKNATHLCQPLDVAFYRPLKMRWRAILDKWKLGLARKSTTVTKEAFPGLLKELCLTVCEGSSEENLISESLVSGFRKCGIVPLNSKEVTARMPQESDVDGQQKSGGVSEAVMTVLKDMRHGKATDNVRKRRSKIDVEPGKSFAIEDVCATATDKGKKLQKKKQCSKRKRQEETNDSSSSEEEASEIDSNDISSNEDGSEIASSDEGEQNSELVEGQSVTGIATTGTGVQLGSVKVDDWILVKFTERKHYVGQVTTVYGNYEFSVNFLRNSSGPNYYIPEKQDLSDIEFPQIVAVLSKPASGRRGMLIFHDNILRSI